MTRNKPISVAEKRRTNIEYYFSRFFCLFVGEVMLRETRVNNQQMSPVSTQKIRKIPRTANSICADDLFW